MITILVPMVQVRILAAEQQAGARAGLAALPSTAEQQVQHQQDQEQTEQPSTSFESTSVGQNQSDCSCHGHPPERV